MHRTTCPAQWTQSYLRRQQTRCFHFQSHKNAKCENNSRIFFFLSLRDYYLALRAGWRDRFVPRPAKNQSRNYIWSGRRFGQNLLRLPGDITGQVVYETCEKDFVVVIVDGFRVMFRPMAGDRLGIASAYHNTNVCRSPNSIFCRPQVIVEL